MKRKQKSELTIQVHRLGHSQDERNWVSPKISWCFCGPDGSNLRPTLGDVAVLSFFPETNKTCFSILLGLKYLSLFSQGRRGTPEATEGRKSLQGSTEVGHVLQLLIV